MKFKEFIKTIILSALVICSLVLSSKIWFSKELWPDGYNSFNYEQKQNIFSKLFSVFSKNDSKALELGQIFSPKQILVNKSSKIALISPNHNESENLNNLLKENLKAVVSKGEFSSVSEDEFKKVCKGDSVFIDFYNPISVEMLADYYGSAVNSDILEIYNVKHILFGIAEEGSLSVYIKNDKTNKMYKAVTERDFASLNELCKNLVKRVEEGSVPASFAFENNFDKKADGDSKKLLLNSYMLINLDMASIANVDSVNILNLKDYSSTEDFAGILKYFNLNPASARRFTDTSGTVNFIENFGTLKFYKDGLLQYTSANESQGVKLKGAFTSDYDVVKMVGEFTAELNSNFRLPSNNKYIFAGVTEGEEMTYTVYFDILYKGVPVILKRQIADGEMLNHAIEIEFSHGRIVSYKQLFCGFDDNGSDLSLPPMITALDEFYTIYDVEKNSDVVINDIYNIYHFDTLNNKVDAKCAVSLSEGGIVIVNPKIAE